MVVARHACLKVAPSTSIVVASESEAISGRHSLDRSGLRRRASAPNKKKEHNLATMRRGYPAFFVQGGSAAGRWETRNDAGNLENGIDGACLFLDLIPDDAGPGRTGLAVMTSSLASLALDGRAKEVSQTVMSGG